MPNVTLLTRVGLAVIVALQPTADAALISVGGSCTLVDAIHAANNDDDSGGRCPPGGSGADTLELTGDVVLTEIVDTTDGDNGLPSITSRITVEGGGFTIMRTAGYQPQFRLLHVAEEGALELRDTTVSDGVFGDGSGGGIFNRGTLVLTSSTVSNNEASLEGGGIYNTGGRLLLTDSTVSSNTGDEHGGGIANEDGAAAVLVNSTVNFNYTNGFGGGVLNRGSELELRGSTIDGNESYADSGGGLANMAGSNATVSKSFVERNEALNEGPSGGGGIYNTGSELTLIDSSVSNNESGQADGGGLWNESDGTVTLTRVIVASNTGDFGAGIANFGSMALIDSEVASNSAYDLGYSGGGGIYNEGELTVQGSTIVDNTAEGNGGGIYNRGVTTLTNSTLSGNESERDFYAGGGLYNRETATVNNSTIVGNAAFGGAGGVQNNGALSLTATLVAANLGSSNCGGNAIVDDGANLDDDGTCGPGFGSLSPVDDADIDHDLLDHGGPTRTHALPAASVAIDAAGGCGLDSDQRRRLRDPLCDSGAFEYDASLPFEIAGRCPGEVVARLRGATPDGALLLVAATSPGSFVLPAGPCAGTELGLANPILLGEAIADSSGQWARELDVAPARCGHLVQVLDTTTCGTSVLAALPP